MKMLACRCAIALFGIAPVLPASAQAPANPQAEALAKCLALKTTGEDRLVVARWLASGLASAPQVAGVVTLKADAKPAADRAMAGLFTRLLTVDCAAQSRPLFAARDNAGFQIAGEALGRVAMQELLTDPKTSAALGDYVKYLDPNDFKAVTK